MSPPSDARTLVLHGLRLKGFAETPAVAEAVAVPEGVVKVQLDDLVTDGLASYRDGRMSGFTLTPAGRLEHARRLQEELEAAGVRPAIEAAYERFLAHNGELLAVCTAWQLRPVDGESRVNDHEDSAYDAPVIERLAALHDRIEPVCTDLGEALERFSGYGPRLGTALLRLQAGDPDWFTKPMIPSYHTVWFELHEDLLATLDIDRGREVAG
ncbi:MAG: transcriptional regulator [Acidimicrobiales bacterium]